MLYLNKPEKNPLKRKYKKKGLQIPKGHLSTGMWKYKKSKRGSKCTFPFQLNQPPEKLNQQKQKNLRIRKSCVM